MARVVKVVLSAQIAQYAEAMEEAARKTATVGTEAEKAAQKRQAFQSLATAATVIGGAMTALTLTVAKTGIEYNTLQQTSRAALSTLLGGAQAATAQMAKLDAFARTSPFSKTTFISAQQQMLAFGIEAKKVIPYLDAIQNATAASGGSNQQLGEIAFVMAQISSAAKITGQDLIQFGQRGINAAELIGSQMGMTGAEIKAKITEGTLGADEALDALAAGMKEKFNGAAANVKDTFAGAMDRVQAAWRDLSADLMKPLVDPNGGGALVGVLNWAADLMRAVQKLPEPIKLVGGSLFAIVGIVALVSGALIFARLKWIDFKIAMEVAGVSGTAVKGKLAGLAGFLGGPWGIAMLAATAAFMTLNKVIEAGVPTQEKLSNALKTSKTAAEGFSAAFERGSVENFLMGDYASELKDLPGLLDHATDAQKNWVTAVGTSVGQRGAYDSIARYGEALAQLASTDLPAATKRFAELVDSQKLSETQAIQLMNEMPAFRDHLVGLATEAGLAADETTLLAFATGKNQWAVKDAATEYVNAQREVQGLTSELTTLMDTINVANGLGQDVVSTNARWQSSLAGITEYVQRQKDAYEEANGSLDGFSMSLDESTALGSANADSLNGVAKAAEAAALAQFELDTTTMGADEATAKYLGTIEAQRQAFIGSAVDAGYNAVEVQKLADKIFALPDERTTKILVEKAQAQADLDNFITMNNGRTIRVNVAADGGSIKMGSYTVSPGNANGGFYENKVKTFASGGFEPGIYPYQPGGLHKFAEEYAEAYISLDPARQKRSEAVWVRTGEALGMFSGGSGSDGSAAIVAKLDQLQAALGRANVTFTGNLESRDWATDIRRLRDEGE